MVAVSPKAEVSWVPGFREKWRGKPVSFRGREITEGP